MQAREQDSRFLTMTSNQQNIPDHWSSEAYSDAAAFVPKLTTTVIKYLDPQPGDHILDLGCGDGILTAQIADTISQHSGEIIGLDASPSMISAAQSKFPNSPQKNCTFHVQDVASFSLEAKEKFLTGKWDKVFSNAALHWILRNPATRVEVLNSAYNALKPGGLFVFEMGGHGCVAEAHSTLIAALIVQGLSPAAAREKSPWFFPSAEWMRDSLARIGFEVEISEIEYRPTKCIERNEHGKGGLEGWVGLMGASFLEGLEGKKKDEVVKLVCESMQLSVTKEDGSQWLGYVRLRAVARKPIS